MKRKNEKEKNWLKERKKKKVIEWNKQKETENEAENRLERKYERKSQRQVGGISSENVGGKCKIILKREKRRLSGRVRSKVKKVKKVWSWGEDKWEFQR